ncbi:hypothetical protein [Kitasatospora aureofaciens]
MYLLQVFDRPGHFDFGTGSRTGFQDALEGGQFGVDESDLLAEEG